MDERERRLAQNEALYREVNERIREQARSQLEPDERHPYEFLCECSNIDCNLLLEFTLAEYEAVRANPRRFVVAPGHHLPEIERVAVRGDAYWVVEKGDEAGEYVEQLDPRSP
jgi:hypothetical protein